MRVRFAPDVTLQQVFEVMDYIKKLGFDCHLEGCGDGGVRLVIEVIVIKPKKVLN